MQEKSFCSKVERLVSETSRIGSVLDLCLLTIDEEQEAVLGEGASGESQTLSQEAAVLGMQIFARRQQQRLAKLAGNAAAYDKIRILGEPTGKHISYDTFLGPDWCSSRQQVALRGVLRDAPNEAEQKRVLDGYRRWYFGRGLYWGDSVHGLTHAFFRPPYSLRAGQHAARRKTKNGWQDVVMEYPEHDEIERLYEQLVGELFYNLANPTLIYEWSDDWSSYFDAGKEWWGTYYWTVAMPDTREIVVIGASTTD